VLERRADSPQEIGVVVGLVVSEFDPQRFDSGGPSWQGVSEVVR